MNHHATTEKHQEPKSYGHNLSDFEYLKKVKKISPAMGLTLVKMKIK